MPRSVLRLPRAGLPGAARVAVAAVAAITVAELAVWLLRPRFEGPQPVPVSASDYFPPAELQRLDDYSGGQRTLMLVGLALEGGTLVALALGRPRFVRRRLEALERRPAALAGFIAGAGISVTLTLVGLPVAAIAHERAVDYGLSTQGIGSWLADQGKSGAIGVLTAAAGGALLLPLMRRLPRGWWLPGAGIAIGYAVFIVGLAPVLLEPLFNNFDRLPPGRARHAVLQLGERAGVQIGEVYRVDASRRSTALNAYVSGLGPTKRVVLYDNLLSGVNHDELRSVVAHELGHQRHDDLWRGLAYVAIVAPLGLLFVRGLGLALARRRGIPAASASALPGYALGIVLAGLVLGLVGNQLSRKVEASADAFALQLTHDPAALIHVQQTLAESNLSDLDPPGWYEALFGTHPSTVQRIGMALAYEKEPAGQQPRQ